MASWMIHLRIADKMLEYLEGIAETEFVVGNIAPDSGVPNEDWSAFFPPTNISHFKENASDSKLTISIERFVNTYFTRELQESYSVEQYSFYLGYLTHLLTDIEWAEHIYEASRAKWKDDFEKEGPGFIWTLKKDWYDLDFLYLKKHPDFRAFQIYDNAVDFKNEFMDIFAEDAFENRRQYITGFYLKGRENLEREHTYLTEAQAEAFVKQTVEKLVAKIQEYLQ